MVLELLSVAAPYVFDLFSADQKKGGSRVRSSVKDVLGFIGDQLGGEVTKEEVEKKLAGKDPGAYAAVVSAEKKYKLHIAELKQAGLVEKNRHDELMADIAFKDRDSARGMYGGQSKELADELAMETIKNGKYLIAFYIFLIIAVTMVTTLINYNGDGAPQWLSSIPEAVKISIGAAVPVITAYIGSEIKAIQGRIELVFNFIFGSSIGSKQKSDQIDKFLKGNSDERKTLQNR